MDGSFDASKLPWHVPFVLNRFEKWALNNCGKLWLRLLTSRDDFLCCAKKTAAARFLSPSSSRNLAKSTHLQNKHCHKIRSWSRAFHKRNLFNSFLLFFFSYWFVFHCFPFCPGPPHHWVMTLTMICCHPAELSELVPGVNIKARRISSQCTAQDATCFRFAGLEIFIVLRCFKERSLRLDRRTLEAELLNDFDDFHQFPTLL